MKNILMWALSPALLVTILCSPVRAAEKRVCLCKHDFEIAQEAEVEMIVTAAAPGADWAVEKAEAGVISVFLDGSYSQDIVLFMGTVPFQYEVMLGRVQPGKHMVELVLASAKSSPGVRSAQVHSISLIPHATHDASCLAYKYSPIIYGRDDNNTTDVPLLMWHEMCEREDGATEIQYSVLWSHEDGGTGPAALLARWGRTTDIEWVYRVVIDAAGRVCDEVYQAAGHRAAQFRGARIDNHPILRTATLNNNMSDSGTSRFLFFLSPRRTLPRGDSSATASTHGEVAAESRPREMLMDLNPWTFQVMAKELARHYATETNSGLHSMTIGDLRDYVYLSYRIVLPESSRVLRDGYYVAPDIEIQVAVKFEGDGTWYTNNRDGMITGLNREGWVRTAIRVPKGRSLKGIEEIKVSAWPARNNSDYELVLTHIGNVLMLDDQYLPMPSVFAWTGEVTLSPKTPFVTFAVKRLQ